MADSDNRWKLKPDDNGKPSDEHANGDRIGSAHEDSDVAPDQAVLPAPTKTVRSSDVVVVYRRAGAYVIDFMLVGFVTVFLGFATGSVSSAGPADTVGTIDIALAQWEAVAILLYRWGMQSAFGFTIGKLIMGLRVVADDGGPAGPIQILGREFVLFAIANLGPFIPQLAVLWIPWVLSLVNLWIAVRRQDHRGIHDLPLRTRVIWVRGGADGQQSPLNPA